MALTLNGSSGISVVDGSASAPSTRGSDSNSGLSYGSDVVNVNAAGTTRLTVNTSGTEINGNLTISSSSNAPKITFDENGADDPKAEIQMDQVSGSSGTLIFKTEGSGTLSERMRIESSGAIRSGVTSAIQAEKYSWFRPESDQNTLAYFHQGATANVTGIIMRHGRGLSGFAGKMIGFLKNNGTEVGSILIGNSSVAYNTSSDYRLKENVTPISDGITRLKTLKPYRFNFKDDTTKPVVDGFFAHEVTAVPEAVTGTKDEVDSENKPVYQAIDQAKLVPLLTAALQEAVGKIETLETKVAALEAA